MRITISSEIEKIVQSVRVEFGDKAELFQADCAAHGPIGWRRIRGNKDCRGVMYSYTMNSVA